MKRGYRYLGLVLVSLPLLATGGCSVTEAVLNTIGLAFEIVQVWL